jgi:molecular chaperone GrpE (heat shock protein)
MTQPEDPQDEFSRKLQELIAEMGDQPSEEVAVEAGFETIPSAPPAPKEEKKEDKLESSGADVQPPPSGSGPMAEVIERLDRLEKHLGSEGELQHLLTEMLRRSGEDVGLRRLFDSLHAELKGYKDDFLFDALQRPFIMDLIGLLDDLRALHRQTADPRTGGARSRIPKEIEQNMRNNVAHLVEILERLGVEEVVEGQGTLDRAIHRLAQTEPTTDASQDGVIAKVLRCGYRWRGRILRPADVVAYRYAEEDQV